MPLSEKEGFEQLFTDLYENRFASLETAFYLWELVRYEVEDDWFTVWGNPLKVFTGRNLLQPGINDTLLSDLKKKAPSELGCAFRIKDRCTLMPNKHVWGYGLSFWFDKDLLRKLSHLTDEDFDKGVHSQLLSDFSRD